jgi:putative tricarboxylic transport membrane protein
VTGERDVAAASDRSLARLAPYIAVICGALFLYYRATQFDYVATAGQIGPDAWPKLILILITATAAFEIVRRLLRPAGAQTQAETVQDEFEMPHGSVRIVVGCIAATVAYLLALEITGFFVSTVVYMSVLIRIGGFRRTGITLLIGFSGALLFMVLFMRLIFVALPIGTGPFATLSVAIMRLIGVH